MLPRTIGSMAHHFNLIVTTAIASTLATGSIMVFGFSSDLYWAPLGLIGVSFAVASFPALSRNFAEKNKKEFLSNFSSVFSHIIFLSIPLSFLLFIFRAQIVRLLYGTRFMGTGYFSWQATKLTAASLGILTISVVSGCLVAFLSRVFYSLCDTKTPVKIAVLCVILNIVFCFLFVYVLQQENFFSNFISSFLKVESGIEVLGLSLALSLSSLLHFFFLYFFLKKKLREIRFDKIVFYKVITSSFFASLLGYLSLRVFDFGTQTVVGLFLQLFLSFIVALCFFLLFSFLLNSKELKETVQSLKKQFRK